MRKGFGGEKLERVVWDDAHDFNWTTPMILAYIRCPSLTGDQDTYKPISSKFPPGIQYFNAILYAWN
jgi:hypothetical protein